LWEAVGGAATSAAKEERSVEICWEEEVGETEVQMMAKERPSAMAMPTLKPSAGRRRQQPRSPEEGRPGGPRATVMRRRAVGRFVGGARLSVLVVGVDSGGGAVEAGRREEAERGSGSWERGCGAEQAG
jgi:hypothetical protein